MSRSSITMLAFALASIVTVVDADTFLALAPDRISKQDVEEALLAELSGLADVGRLQSIQEELSPMYEALPKGAHGKLDTATVRYALHRYFAQKHAWVIRGLDPADGQAEMNSTIMKERAPSYIQNVFETTHSQGLGLWELAAFAATLTDLVHKESVDMLGSIFDVLSLPRVGGVKEKDASFAVKAYLVTHLMGENTTGQSRRDFSIMEFQLQKMYPSWKGHTAVWAEDLRRSHDIFTLQLRRNPFVGHLPNFDDCASFVEEFGYRFASFQNWECHQLKNDLMDLEHDGTGRVRLSEFYGSGHSQFVESVSYLRALGALDETDPQHPEVVIPNYINNQNNCLATSGFYAVCCIDECEGLLGKLETELAAPTATPARLARVVSGLPSETVEAPRNLSASLLSNLDRISELHNGRVPLHSRLFSQWMHKAYPRECSFTHEARSTTSLDVAAWQTATGISATFKQADMLPYIEDLSDKAPPSEARSPQLPWSSVEELISEEHRQVAEAEAAARFRALARIAMAFGALASCALMLWRSAREVTTPCEDQKYERYSV